MKTEVYSWRVSSDLKMGLEREARRRKTSVSAVLEAAAREWLSKSSGEETDEELQRRLHNAAAKCFGSISGDDPNRSENVRQLMRQRLQGKRDR